MNKIEKWAEIKNQLALLTAEEKRLRNEILVEEFSYNPEKCVSGTQVAGTLKATFKISHKLEQELVPLTMGKIYNMGADAQACAKDLVKVKYELNKRAYDKLPAEIKKVFDDVVTTTSVMPSLEIVEGK